MADDLIFLTDTHATSRRTAVFEADVVSAWLYLSEPKAQTPAADAWVCNRIPAPPASEIKSYRGGPPPAPLGYASDKAFCKDATAHEWSFVWSLDGHSVAILKDGTAAALIIASQKHGYCRELLKEGPWGHPWSEQLFQQHFGT